MSKDGEQKDRPDEDEATDRAVPAAAPVEPEVDDAQRPTDDRFTNFVMGLATLALVSLSEQSIDDRISAGRVNLREAAEHIDTLSMLEEKTRGNLSANEAKLLEDILYDVRMRYLQVAGRQ